MRPHVSHSALHIGFTQSVTWQRQCPEFRVNTVWGQSTQTWLCAEEERKCPEVGSWALHGVCAWGEVDVDSCFIVLFGTVGGQEGPSPNPKPCPTFDLNPDSTFEWSALDPHWVQYFCLQVVCPEVQHPRVTWPEAGYHMFSLRDSCPCWKQHIDSCFEQCQILLPILVNLGNWQFEHRVLCWKLWCHIQTSLSTSIFQAIHGLNNNQKMIPHTQCGIHWILELRPTRKQRDSRDLNAMSDNGGCVNPPAEP